MLHVFCAGDRKAEGGSAFADKADACSQGNPTTVASALEGYEEEKEGEGQKARPGKWVEGEEDGHLETWRNSREARSKQNEIDQQQRQELRGGEVH